MGEGCVLKYDPENGVGLSKIIISVVEPYVHIEAYLESKSDGAEYADPRPKRKKCPVF